MKKILNINVEPSVEFYELIDKMKNGMDKIIIENLDS